MKKLNIRTDIGVTVTRDIPDISLDLKPEYPEKWFRDHRKSKPVIILPKSKLNLDQLMQKMGDHWPLDHEIEPTLEFLNYYIKNFLKERLLEKWTSYGVTIGEKGHVVTPLDLLKVETYEASYSPTLGSQLNEEEFHARFATIMTIYRANTVSGSIGDYPTRVIKQMETTLKEAPYRIETLDSGVISSKISWGSNETFRKLVAAVDMFYNKFRDSQFSKIKVATLPARDKDCGGLVAITDLSAYLGLDTVTALSYVMDARVVPELMRLTEELGEISQQDSYFHYFKELGLSNKSPYSSTMNPTIYNFTYSVGTFMGNRRACNARLFSDIGFTNTVNIAAYVAYYFRKWVNISIVVGEVETLEMAQRLDESGGLTGEEKKDCLYIYSRIVDNNFEVTVDIKRELKKVLNSLVDLREGTIGKQIQQMFV